MVADTAGLETIILLFVFHMFRSMGFFYPPLFLFFRFVGNFYIYICPYHTLFWKSDTLLLCWIITVDDVTCIL